ncbi:uncharacterized protein TNCV_118051 [Trichonephila clavipes]|nr:uncharacterized protein TNCV_118051 [Trichonephila clavipes]
MYVKSVESSNTSSRCFPTNLVIQQTLFREKFPGQRDAFQVAPHPHVCAPQSGRHNPAVAGEMPFDEVLPNAGSNGRYQHFLLWLVLLPAQLPFGSHGYSQLLMSWTPDYWCKVPELDAIANASSHLYMKIRLYLAREYRDWEMLYSQCTLNRTVYSQAVHQESGLNFRWNSTASTRFTCDAHGWYYNKSYLGEDLETIVSANDDKRTKGIFSPN